MIKVWVFAEKFPNIIQPWLANSISQVVRLQGDVKIFSMTAGDKVYSSTIIDHGLLEKIEVLHFNGIKSIVRILLNFLSLKLLLRSLNGLTISFKFCSKYKSHLSNIVTSLVLAPFLKPQKVDIIHSHFEIAGHKLLPIVKAQKVPFVITFHGLPPPNVNQLPTRLRSEYTQIASAILVNTEFAKQQYINLGVDKSKFHILPQGTDTRKFNFISKPFPVDNIFRILTVGRLSVDKGHTYALEGISKLINNGVKIKYTVVGQGPDRDKLEELAKELRIGNHVKFKTGLTEDELIEEYHKAHIFLLPSLRARDGSHEETQGVVIQEAQSCGSIVIATKAGGIPECVDDGENAFLVEDRDSDAIADKIEFIINNPANWLEWQLKARKLVEEKYDVNVIGEKLMAFYKSLIG